MNQSISKNVLPIICEGCKQQVKIISRCFIPGPPTKWLCRDCRQEIQSSDGYGDGDGDFTKEDQQWADHQERRVQEKRLENVIQQIEQSLASRRSRNPNS